MLFSSLVFLWIFLPVLLALSRLLPRRAQNGLLLIASLLFYAWGEPKNILLMLVSITANWLLARCIGAAGTPGGRRGLLVLSVVFNLGLLGFFKYTDFALSAVNAVLGTDWAAGIALPIGISFYTFQALSYVIDVYRGEAEVQQSWFKIALYISFFPQLIAGPIVQYGDIARQLEDRQVTPGATAYGIKRFLYGLAKKVILANAFAAAADQIFGIGAAAISTPVAWLASLLYALQIYYDFSGYSDMAIGLGKLFGFTFKENFNYPYISRSCTEFWRRWHISLSSWFRNYLYIPLGGNRGGIAKTYRNLVIVFFCTGLWHGANWQFIAWGLYYGALLVAERLFLKKWLDRLPVLSNLYTMVAVLVGWVIFRAPGLREGMGIIKAMFLPTAGSAAYPLARFVDGRILFLVVVGILLCGPVQALLPRLKKALYDEQKVNPVQMVVQLALLFACVMLLVSGTYNPFIYFRF
ncbi:MBOAT family protein [Ruminococcaceae bacterium OttesenSCG-928-D13]|nr:MBOAT family protein [Ruminococcaceae bacterium OttesenSCG-928-D13]